MVRKALCAALCLAAALAGCGKGDNESDAQNRRVRVIQAEARPPAGMVPISAGASAFIDTEPVTVFEYVGYLKGTSQPVPLRWEGIAADTPGADQAMTGLTLEEASRCATWYMKRVPTLDEWKKAVRAVGAQPYPWTAEGEPVAGGAPILLVRDWLPGTSSENRARDASRQLAQKILDDARADVQALRARLTEAAQDQKVRREDAWKRAKPAVFQVLERERRLAEAAALREGRKMELQVLNKIARQKGQMAIDVTQNKISPDEAAALYKKDLAEHRDALRKAREDLDTGIAVTQEEVRKLTKQFEDAGAAVVEGGITEAEAALAETDVEVADMAQAVGVLEKLNAALADLQASEGRFRQAMPDVDELARQEAALAEKTAPLEGEDPAKAESDDIRTKIAAFGQHIGGEVLEEDVFFKEMDDVAQLRARKRGLEARLAGLRKSLVVPAPVE